MYALVPQILFAEQGNMGKVRVMPQFFFVSSEPGMWTRFQRGHTEFKLVKQKPETIWLEGMVRFEIEIWYAMQHHMDFLEKNSRSQQMVIITVVAALCYNSVVLFKLTSGFISKSYTQETEIMLMPSHVRLQKAHDDHATHLPPTRVMMIHL